MTDPSGLSPAGKDGQFFANDNQTWATGSEAGGGPVDASNHVMGATTWTDLAYAALTAPLPSRGFVGYSTSPAISSSPKAEVSTSAVATLPDGTLFGLENVTVCPPVAFKITGIGPAQAPGITALTSTPRALIEDGGVAIKPANFGVALPLSLSTRNELTGVTFYVSWQQAEVPKGIPTIGPFFAMDNIGPDDVRNEPGNHFDVYNYAQQSQAYASTRTQIVTTVIPANSVRVRCPR